MRFFHSDIEEDGGAVASASDRNGLVVENCRWRADSIGDAVELVVHREATRPARSAVCMGRSSMLCREVRLLSARRSF